LNSSILIH